MSAEGLEFFLERGDTFAKQAAVSLQLLFTRTTQTDAAFLPFEVGPAANQTGGEMLQLGQFDLKLALVAARTLGENIQDQAAAVYDAALQLSLKIALLSRREYVIENNDADIVPPRCICNLHDLSLACKSGGVWTGAFTADGLDRRYAST